MSPHKTPRTALLAALAAVLIAGPAGAQGANPALAATRRDLIAQALAARAANAHPRALDLAQRAGQIEMSVSLRRFIAEEQESVGLVAEAMNSAELCVREGAGARDASVHVDACRAMSARIQGRIGRLTVSPPSPPPDGLTVLRGRDQSPRILQSGRGSRPRGGRSDRQSDEPCQGVWHAVHLQRQPRTVGAETSSCSTRRMR